MIPDELKQHRQWLHWKAVIRDSKPTKMPIQSSGAAASSTDPATWCDFNELSKSISNIGFVFTPTDPYIGIDLDSCRDPLSGKLDDWAREVVERFDTYTEVSPSQTGVKLFGATDTFWRHSNNVKLPQFGKGYQGKEPGIEVYDSGRYFAVTGNHLKGLSEIATVDDHLEWLAETFKMARSVATIDGTGVRADTPLAERAAKYVAKMDPSISGSGGHNSAFAVACALVLGFDLPADQAYAIMATEFNPRCNPPWSEKELRHKIESAGKQPGQRGYIRDASPADWSKIVIRSTPELRIARKPEPEQPGGPRHTTLASATAAYLQQVEEGTGNLLTTGIPDLDFAIDGGIAPGEMVIVAGRPSHGKSAIALQMVHHMTAKGIGAVIVSEEMSALALGKRAIQFAVDIPVDQWKTSRSDVREQLDYHFSKRADAVIIESCGSVERVVAEVEKAIQTSSIGIVVVDYVQLLTAKGGNRYEQVTEASQQMRKLASRTGVAVIVLAQLSRAIESRPKFVPQASDLKETGQLEQDADVIIFGVWPHRIDPNLSKDDYQFYVAKNRNREIKKNAFKVTFEASRQRLVDQSVKLMGNYEHEFEEYA